MMRGWTPGADRPCAGRSIHALDRADRFVVLSDVRLGRFRRDAAAAVSRPLPWPRLSASDEPWAIGAPPQLCGLLSFQIRSGFRGNSYLSIGAVLRSSVWLREG